MGLAIRKKTMLKRATLILHATDIFIRQAKVVKVKYKSMYTKYINNSSHEHVLSVRTRHDKKGRLHRYIEKYA